MKPPLRIGLVMQGGTGWMGGTEYIRNLALSLHGLRAERGGDFEVCLIAGGALDAALRGQLAPFVGEIFDGLLDRRDTAAGRCRTFFQQSILRRPNARFSAFLRAARIDFLYPLTYANRKIGVSLPVGAAFGECRWAGWIPDFQHRHMPQYFDAAEIRKRDRGIEALSRDARTIVFSSEAAARDFREFFPASRARVELLRFCTAPQSAWYEGDPAAVEQRYHLPGRFFLVSNQFWQHKNHAVIFDALQALASQADPVRPHLVCTGHPHDAREENHFNALLGRLHRSGIAPQVSLLGLIPRSDQMQLMRRSLAVIQPSLFEGWSTVVEDARALGKRIAISDIPVHLEQHPPGARVFARDSAESLAAILAEWWTTLAPGPEPSEAAAQTAAAGALLASGARFLEIAYADSTAR